jgi:hypothetical protein
MKPAENSWIPALRSLMVLNSELVSTIAHDFLGSHIQDLEEIFQPG